MAAGGEVIFEAQVSGVEIRDEQIRGPGLGDTLVEGAAVILATGHLPEIFMSCSIVMGVRLRAKSFAMGVRVEHPQQLIDSIQYHMPERGEYLPAAAYSLVAMSERTRVYSFCMCPGGFIVPAMTRAGEVSGQRYVAVRPVIVFLPIPAL